MIDTMLVNIPVVERFGRLHLRGRLAHAYLLTGPQDSGKTQTALSVAQLVNCEAVDALACGVCASCRKIASGNHPDVFLLGSKETVKIEDIRFLLNRAHLTAYEAKIKVFIICHVELMTHEAANALLKTLEEPSAGTLMILTTRVLEANLDTIKSRCQIIPFLPLTGARLLEAGAQAGAMPAQWDFLSFYGEGSLGKMRQWLEANFYEHRRRIIDAMLVHRAQDSFLKKLSEDPQETAQVLKILLSFFRDVFLFKNGVAATALVHQDCLKIVEGFASRSVEDIVLIVRQIVQTKKFVDQKLNIKMALSLLREYLWGY